MTVRTVVNSLLAFAAMDVSAIPTGHQAVTIPFDFSRSAIGLNVTVREKSLYMILDTGVNPSVVDLSRAEQLGLKIDRHDGGDPSGFGEEKGAAVFPSTMVCPGSVADSRSTQSCPPKSCSPSSLRP